MLCCDLWQRRNKTAAPLSHATCHTNKCNLSLYLFPFQFLTLFCLFNCLCLLFIYLFIYTNNMLLLWKLRRNAWKYWIEFASWPARTGGRMQVGHQAKQREEGFFSILYPMLIQPISFARRHFWKSHPTPFNTTENIRFYWIGFLNYQNKSFFFSLLSAREGFNKTRKGTLRRRARECITSLQYPIEQEFVNCITIKF